MTLRLISLFEWDLVQRTFTRRAPRPVRVLFSYNGISYEYYFLIF